MEQPSQRRAAQEPAHDVLAAEAFAVPAADPALRERQVRLPEDPSGIAEAHDILAAEEFAMPAPTPGSRLGRSRAALAAAGGHRQRRALLGVAGLAALLLRRRRGR